MNTELKKVIRNGKVAVLYSPSFGSGWYSWNMSHPQCLFSPEIVELIEAGNKHLITDEFCKKLFNSDNFYVGSNVDDLTIEWLPIGTHFHIGEFDGAENIMTLDDIKLIA